MMGIIRGLALTLKYALIGERVTMQYPHVKRETPRYRGLQSINKEKCIACSLCVRICPNQTIGIEIKPGREKSRNIEDYNYRVNLGRCLWCGLCVDACPTGALSMTPVFELSQCRQEDLIYTIIPK